MQSELTRFGLLAVYAVISVAGMTMLKGAESVLGVRSILGFALYLAGFLMWIGVILRIMPLSQAFPLAAGALMLGTQLTGWLLLKERIGLWQLAGVLFILIGVIMVNLSAAAKN